MFNNESCLARPTLIDANPNELYYYPFMISLDRYDGSFRLFDDFLDFLMIYEVKYVVNKTEDVNLNVFDMIRINETKTLAKHILCDCKCKFNGRKCTWYWKRNSNKCWCLCQNSIKP